MNDVILTGCSSTTVSAVGVSADGVVPRLLVKGDNPPEFYQIGQFGYNGDER